MFNTKKQVFQEHSHIQAWKNKGTKPKTKYKRS